MPGKLAPKLAELDIDEHSGVDHPAHQAPGWLVMKAASDPDFAAQMQELLAEAERLEKGADELMKALEDNVTLFDDAPDSVKEAINAVHDYMKQLAEDGTVAEPEKPQQAANKESGLLARLASMLGLSKDEDDNWGARLAAIAKLPEEEQKAAREKLRAEWLKANPGKEPPAGLSKAEEEFSEEAIECWKAVCEAAVTAPDVRKENVRKAVTDFLWEVAKHGGSGPSGLPNSHGHDITGPTGKLKKRPEGKLPFKRQEDE
jgi:hypothetical protein